MVKNIIKKSNKTGFTLAEALVSMLILSLFFVATAKVVTTKQPRGKIAIVHGFYECYYEDGNHKETISDGGNIKKKEDVNECVFTPSNRLPNANLYYINTEKNHYYTTLHPYLNPKEEKDFGTLNSFDPNMYFQKEEKYENSTEETETETENKIEELGNYLINAYPNSVVAQKLKDGNNVTAIFIAW